ncbi:hypothetical protein P879_06213 [Paragonimus westermani]|uniref:Uncharacterized protein n=1 Tax=Paragonimus westermani TaxID=34504 RepID=A0A8T0DV10_9TREM|nr:hypothetical protein P879_06213 [Paragonimus westermani]
MDTRSGSQCTQTSFPWWMEATDVSDSDSDLDEGSPGDVAQTTIGLSDPAITKTNPVLTNSRIARHLECLLQATDPLGLDADRTRPSLRMLHNRRSAVAHQKPLVPVGETVTFQLPLSNFLQIPLALTNLHLLWTFECEPTPIFTDSTPHARLITNEPGTDGFTSGPRSCQFVSTEIVPEFIMLPDENKTLEVSVITKKMGELQITGLCFDWNFAFSSNAHYQSRQSVTFSAGDPHDPDRHDDPSTPLVNSSTLYKSPVTNTSFVSTGVNRSSVNPLERSNSVRGRITLSEPVASAETVTTPLAWTVTRPAPLLKVVFSELPSKLFQGQVCRLQLFVSNVGTEPLCGVRVASNWPGCITFGSDKFANDTNTNAVYQFCQSTNDSSVLKALDDQVVLPCLDVPYQRSSDGNRSPMEPMLPGTTTSMPMWLRAPHITNPHRRHWKHRQQGNSPPLRSLAVTTGVNYSTIVQTRTVHMVFQNRSISPNSVYPVLNSRFLRHHHEMELQPSLRLEAVANPNVCSDVRDLLVTLRVQNMTLKTTRSTFELVQVSCASRYWLITPISQPSPQPVSTSIGPNETVTIHLRAKTRRSCGAEMSPSTYISPNSREDYATVVNCSPETLFSTVPLQSEPRQQTIVQVTGSPCLDFFYRSGTHWNRCGVRASRTPKIDTLGRRLDIVLILIWKTRSCGLSTDSGNTFVYGQSHVAVTRLGVPAVVPSDEKVSVGCMFVCSFLNTLQE